MKLQFKQKNYKEMMIAYKEMLTYIKCAAPRRAPPQPQPCGAPSLSRRVPAAPPWRRRPSRGYPTNSMRGRGSP